MPLYLTDDQTLLRDSAREFMAGEGGIVAQYRKYRDMDCKDGFGHALWRQFGEMGFTGILVDADRGGLGLGHVEAGIVAEEVGRNLTPSPFLISAVGFVEALRGTDAAEQWFPGILAGETVAALALDEGPKHRPERIALAATRSGNGFVLNGAKQFVVQGASADVLLVAARTAGEAGETRGLSLFLVPRDAPGLGVEGVRLADASIGARLRFDNVAVDGEALIGDADDGWTVLTRILAAVRAAAASELLGVASASAERTVDYLGTRQQFGRAIGSFQALQHRAAHLHGEIEIVRAVVLKAQQALDAGDADAETWVSVAKAKAGRVSTLACQESVQMHGGIGMTDEHDIGLYMKRDRVLNEMFGDARFHEDRVAAISGY